MYFIDILSLNALVLVFADQNKLKNVFYCFPIYTFKCVCIPCPVELFLYTFLCVVIKPFDVISY